MTLEESLLPTLEVEKANYDLHENCLNDQGYVDFLNQLCAPLVKKLSANAQGLDFGCGPGPTISEIFQRTGQLVKNYDPLYFPEKELLAKKYDFVTCTEVVEHFHYPWNSFQILKSLLKPNGVLAIMTQTLTDPSAAQFASWHYTRDPTHVSFYQENSFEWIGKQLDLRLEIHKSSKSTICFFS